MMLATSASLPRMTLVQTLRHFLIHAVAAVALLACYCFLPGYEDAEDKFAIGKVLVVDCKADIIDDDMLRITGQQLRLE